REALDVAALALGINGVEGERRLARAGQAGEHHQLVARDGDVDVLKVVLAGAADGDGAAIAGGAALVEQVIHAGVYSLCVGAGGSNTSPLPGQGGTAGTDQSVRSRNIGRTGRLRQPR